MAAGEYESAVLIFDHIAIALEALETSDPVTQAFASAFMAVCFTSLEATTSKECMSVVARVLAGCIERFPALVPTCVDFSVSGYYVPVVYLIFHPMAKRACACAQRPGLPQVCGCNKFACRHLQARCGGRLRNTLAAVPGLLAHASVTEVVTLCPMGPKLRYRYIAILLSKCFALLWCVWYLFVFHARGCLSDVSWPVV